MTSSVHVTRHAAPLTCTPRTHLLVPAAGFSLQQLKQASGRQPSCRIDKYHPLFQVIREVHGDAKTHLEDMTGIMERHGAPEGKLCMQAGGGVT